MATKTAANTGGLTDRKPAPVKPLLNKVAIDASKDDLTPEKVFAIETVIVNECLKAEVAFDQVYVEEDVLDGFQEGN